MKIALSVWKDCISTVFDAADQLLVVDKDIEGTFKRTSVRINSADGSARALQLKEMGIGVLICGAISRPQEAAISASGITVYPFVRGPIQEILDAYLDGRLHLETFALPGCYGQGRDAGRGRRRAGTCRRGSS
jgi:predicted Fe-Mo cluster-binding NifX family protein